MDGDLIRALALSVKLRHWGRAVSLQFSILKVLAGQPGGCATVTDLNRYITLLSGSEWTARMKRLSARAPDLDIFGSRYVLRDETGWQLTEAGQAFLASIEMPASIEIAAPAACDHEVGPLEVIVTAQAPTRQPATPALRLVVDNSGVGRRTRRKDREKPDGEPVSHEIKHKRMLPKK